MSGGVAGPVASVRDHAKLETRSSLPVGGVSSHDVDILSSRLMSHVHHMYFKCVTFLLFYCRRSKDICIRRGW